MSQLIKLLRDQDHDLQSSEIAFKDFLNKTGDSNEFGFMYPKKRKNEKPERQMKYITNTSLSSSIETLQLVDVDVSMSSDCVSPIAQQSNNPAASTPSTFSPASRSLRRTPRNGDFNRTLFDDTVNTLKGLTESAQEFWVKFGEWYPSRLAQWPSDGQISQQWSKEEVKHFLNTVRLNPYFLSAEFEIDIDRVVVEMVRATQHSVFNIRWSLMCPTCSCSLLESNTLTALPTQARCVICGVIYGPDLSSYVIATFQLHPSIHYIPINNLPCPLPLHLQQNYISEVIIGPDVKKYSSNIVLDAGEYILCCLLTGRRTVLHVEGDPSSQPQDLEIIQPHQPNFSAFRPANCKTKPGLIRLHIYNELSNTISRLFILRNRIITPPTVPHISSSYITALQLIHHPLWSMKLAGDSQFQPSLPVSQCSVVCLDVMDVNADNLKSILTKYVSRYHGRVIRSLFNTYMASFIHPFQSLMCMLDSIHNFPNANGLRFRIGIHLGIVSLVSFNEGLDIVGEDITKVALIHGQAQENHIVWTEPVHLDVHFQRGIHTLQQNGIELKTEQKNILINGLQHPIFSATINRASLAQYFTSINHHQYFNTLIWPDTDQKLMKFKQDTKPKEVVKKECVMINPNKAPSSLPTQIPVPSTAPTKETIEKDNNVNSSLPTKPSKSRSTVPSSEDNSLYSDNSSTNTDKTQTHIPTPTVPTVSSAIPLPPEVPHNEEIDKDINIMINPNKASTLMKTSIPLNEAIYSIDNVNTVQLESDHLDITLSLEKDIGIVINPKASTLPTSKPKVPFNEVNLIYPESTSISVTLTTLTEQDVQQSSSSNSVPISCKTGETNAITLPSSENTESSASTATTIIFPPTEDKNGLDFIKAVCSSQLISIQELQSQNEKLKIELESVKNECKSLREDSGRRRADWELQLKQDLEKGVQRTMEHHIIWKKSVDQLQRALLESQEKSSRMEIELQAHHGDIDIYEIFRRSDHFKTKHEMTLEHTKPKAFPESKVVGSESIAVEQRPWRKPDDTKTLLLEESNHRIDLYFESLSEYTHIVGEWSQLLLSQTITTESKLNDSLIQTRSLSQKVQSLMYWDLERNSMEKDAKSLHQELLAKDIELDKIRHSKWMVEVKCEELQQKLAQTNWKIAEHEGATSQILSQLNKSGIDNNTLKEKLSTIEPELKSTQEKVLELTSKLEKINEVHRQEIDGWILKLRYSEETTQQKIIEIRSLEEKYNETQKISNNTKLKLDSLVETLKSMENRDVELNKEIKQLKDEIKLSKEREEELKKDYESMRTLAKERELSQLDLERDLVITSKELQEHHSLHKQEIDIKEEKISDLTIALREAQTRIRELEEDARSLNEELRQSLDLQNQKVNELSFSLDDSEKKQENLQTELEKVIKELQNHQPEITKLRTELTNAKEEIKKLKSELLDKETKMKELKESIQEKETKYESEMKEFSLKEQDLQRQLNENKEWLKKKTEEQYLLEREVVNISRKLDIKEQEHQLHISKLQTPSYEASLKAELAALRAEMEVKESQIRTLKEENDCQNISLDATTSKLNKQLEESRNECNKIQKDLTYYKTETENLTRDLQSYRSDVQILNAQILTLKQTISKLESDLAKANKDNNTQKEELKKQIEELQTTLKSKSEEQINTEFEIVNMAEEMTKLNEQYQDKERQVRILSEALTKTNPEYQSSPITNSSVSKEITEMLSDRRDEQDPVSDLVTENIRMSVEQVIIQKEISEINDDIKDANDAHQRKMGDLQEEIDTLSNWLKEKQIKEQCLQTELESLRAQKIIQAQEHQKLENKMQEDVDNLVKILQSKVAEHTLLENEILRLKSLVNEATSPEKMKLDILVIENNIKQKQEAIKSLETEIALHSATSSNDLEIKLRTQADLNRLKSQLSELTTHHEELLKRRNDLLQSANSLSEKQTQQLTLMKSEIIRVTQALNDRTKQRRELLDPLERVLGVLVSQREEQTKIEHEITTILMAYQRSGEGTSTHKLDMESDLVISSLKEKAQERQKLEDGVRNLINEINPGHGKIPLP